MTINLTQSIEASGLLTLRRYELIDCIRKIAQPATFDRILYWPTDMLRLYILDHELDKARRRTCQHLTAQARLLPDRK